MLPDKKTIVVTNDNDFGMAMEVKDAENQNTETSNYVLHADGAFTYRDKPAAPNMHVVPNEAAERKQVIWFIELLEPLK